MSLYEYLGLPEPEPEPEPEPDQLTLEIEIWRTYRNLRRAQEREAKKAADQRRREDIVTMHEERRLRRIAKQQSREERAQKRARLLAEERAAKQDRQRQLCLIEAQRDKLLAQERLATQALVKGGFDPGKRPDWHLAQKSVRPHQAVCTRCGSVKYQHEFRPSMFVIKHYQPSAVWCRDCQNHYQRKRYHENGGYEGMIARHRLAKYGLSEAGYEQLLKDQNFCCALCKQSFSGIDRRRIHIDHDHKTNQVRGIVCQPCNIFLGHCEKVGQDALVRVTEYLGPTFSPAE